MTWNNFCLHKCAHSTHKHTLYSYLHPYADKPPGAHTHTYCHSFPNWIETLPCDIYISNNRRLLRGPAAPISQHRMGNCYFGTEVLPVCVLKCNCVCVCAQGGIIWIRIKVRVVNLLGICVCVCVSVHVWIVTEYTSSSSSSSSLFICSTCLDDCLCSFGSGGRQQAASVAHSSSAWYLVLGWRSLLSAHIVPCCKSAAACFRWLVWLDLSPSLACSFSLSPSVCVCVCVCVWIRLFQANMWAAASCSGWLSFSVNMCILNELVFVFACVFECRPRSLRVYFAISVLMLSVCSCTSILMRIIFIQTLINIFKKTNCEVTFSVPLFCSRIRLRLGSGLEVMSED